MTGKTWLVAVAVCLLFTGSGCVSCCHQAAKVALEKGPTCEVPKRDRDKVYAVLVNGLTPNGSAGLEGLRDRLAEHGFTKVYYGQLYHAWWMAMEMRTIHKDDPTARFVLVGYDFGCSLATWIANDAVEDGLNVDAVFLLDPVGKQDMASCKVRTVLVRGCSATGVAPHTESVVIPGANHFTLPADPQTVSLVYGVLKNSAYQVQHPPVYEFGLPASETLRDWKNQPNPSAIPPEWRFLNGQPGSQSGPLTPAPALPVPPGPQVPALPNTPEVLNQSRQPDVVPDQTPGQFLPTSKKMPVRP